MITEAAAARLASVPLLRALPPDRLETVRLHTRELPLARGELAFGDDAPAAAWVGIVAQGLVRTVSWSAGGRRTVLWLSGPGESFGERILFGDPRYEAAEAAETSVVWRIPAAMLRAELAAHAGAAAAVAELLAVRLGAASAALEDAVARDVSGRLARRLCEFAERFGRPHAGGSIAVSARITHEDLADMVGASREAVTRALGDFRAQGWLAASQGRHVLADPAALRARAGLA